MGIKLGPSIALVTSDSRLQGLLKAYGTRGAAKFKLSMQRRSYQEENSALKLDDDLATFDRYVDEDDAYNRAVEKVRHEIEGLGFPVVHVPRNYLSTYYFGATEVIVVVGPDGLVANAAKYSGGLPIIGVNPDPQTIDGILLSYDVDSVRRAVRKTLQGTHNADRVTLAEAELSDGQRMLAFNDFFLGRRTHISARYVLYSGANREPQSSSGIIVSTGAGSTGWLSSVYNMMRGLTGQATQSSAKMPWDTDHLRWVVREPFQSHTSQVSMVTGDIHPQAPLRVESLMPQGGVIFSDGIEDDFLEFNSGVIAEFKIATEGSQLVRS